MTNPKKHSKQGVKLDLRQAYLEETTELVAGVLAEQGINFLSDDTIGMLAAALPERLLHDNDSRLRWAAILGVALGAAGLQPATRDAVKNFFVQGVEEVGKISGKLDVDNPEESRKAIRGAVERRKGGLLAALRGDKKDQGDKVQKKALPDYFTAKAAVKDDALRANLSAIELAFQASDQEAFAHFMQKGAFRIQTTPEELIDIAKTSKPDADVTKNHAYGIERLKSLMSGQRGEGSAKSKLKTLAEDILDDVLHSHDADSAAERFGQGVTDTRQKVKAATAKQRRFD